MIGAQRFALAAMLLVSPAEGVAQEPRERDVWYELARDGVRFGFQHVEVTRLTDGNYRFAVEAELRIELFGRKQEITSRGHYVVTPGLRPVSMRVEGTDMTGESLVTGEMQRDQLVLTVRRGDEVREHRIACGGETPAIFSVCIADWLRSRRDLDRAVFREIEEHAWQTGTVVATRWTKDGAPLTVWQLDDGSGLGGWRYTLDEHAQLESALDELQGMYVRRCPEEQARELVHRTMDGSEVLTFPLDKPIHAPSRLRQLDVRLTWRDIAFEEFDLEDGRQRVREQTERDGVFTVVLELRPPEQAADDATIPVDAPEFRPYLAETQFVKPTHEKIVAAARRAIDEEKNAMAAVRRLSRWVHGYIEGEMSATTLTGPEVLECRSGKCTEYSTLFASLARAVGIPTRLALGERMVAGQWMGHMWNEAWVGRWVSVDASVDEVDHSLALLKFVHSDTVMGTQAVRWKLTRSLAISIEDFELAPSALADRYTTGIAGSTYTSVDHACRIAAPGAGWTLEDKTSAGAATVRFKLAGADGVMIHFVAFELPAGTAPKAITDARLRRWRDTYTEFELLADEARAVAGAPGHVTRFRGKTREGLTNGSTEVVWIQGNSGYLLNLIALAGDHDAHVARFEELVAAFEFLDG